MHKYYNSALVIVLSYFGVLCPANEPLTRKIFDNAFGSQFMGPDIQRPSKYHRYIYQGMSILNADDLRLSVTEQQQTMHSSSFNRTSTFFALQMNLSIVKYLIIHSVYSLWVQTFDNNRNITEIFFRESQPFWFVVMRSKASGWWKWSRDIWGTPLSMTFIMEEIFLCKHVFLIIGNVYRHKIHC